MAQKINWDAWGILTSVLCAIHCALLPLVASALPLLGVGFLHNPLFEYGMIGLALIIGTWALWHGFRHHHHRLTPWLLFLTGMTLLIAKQLWHQYELYLLPFAVGCIISAHIVNYRLSRPLRKVEPAPTLPARKAEPGPSQPPGPARLVFPDFKNKL